MTDASWRHQVGQTLAGVIRRNRARLAEIETEHARLTRECQQAVASLAGLGIVYEEESPLAVVRESAR